MPFCADNADRWSAQRISATNAAPAWPMRLRTASTPAGPACRPASSSSSTRALNPLAQPAAQGSSVLVKVLVGFLVFILLIVLAVMGSCVYIGYRAKKKADEIQQAYKSNDLNKLAGALGAGSSKTRGQGSRRKSAASSTSAPLSFPAWTPSSGAESGSKIPLRPGLTVVTAIAQFGGDYESIKQIQQVSASAVRLSYRADNVPNPLEGLQKLSGDKAPKSSGSVSRSTHGPRRGSANRARLYAMVRSQPAAKSCPG